MAVSYIPSGFLSFLSVSHSGFASLPNKQQSAAAHTLYQGLINQYAHNSGIPGVFPIFWKDKGHAYGSASKFETTNQQLKWFYQVLHAEVGTQARGFRLTEAARELGLAYFEQSISETAPVTTGLQTPDGKRYRAAQSAIRSKTSTGANCKRFMGASLEPDVRIDTEAVRQLHAACRSWERKEQCPPGCEALYERWNRIRKENQTTAETRVQRTSMQALAMLDVARRYLSSGDLVPCTYIESIQGRLYAEGCINLQGCIRELRMAALKGCYDVDIDNCHWRLLAELARRQDVKTPHINHYLMNKDLVRDKLAADLEISLDDAKATMIGLIYGAKLSLSNERNKSAIQKRIGAFAMFNARYHALLRPLYDEINIARKSVVELAKKTSGKPGWVINDAGKQIRSSSGQSLILAHLLQGAESEILRVCLESCSGIVVIQHDGFTCKEQVDTAALAGIIKTARNYSVTFSQELL